MMKYTQFLPIFKGYFAVILTFNIQNISSVQTDYLRANVTRQSDGDILIFKDTVDCASLNAKCSRLPNNKRETTKSKYNKCDSCKCLSEYSTYVSTENQCINTNEMTTLNCRIFRQRQVTVLTKSTKAVSRPIQAYRCKIKEQHPEYYFDNNGTATWIRMIDVGFSLNRFTTSNRRPSWLVTFNNNTISKMLSKYAGRIVKLKLSCRMRRLQRKQTDLCIIFKIAGTVTDRNLTIVRHGSYRPPSTDPTREDTTILLHTASSYRTESPSTIKTSLSSGHNTAQDQKSKSVKNNHVIWIIITVLIVIIIILTGVIVFICFKRRKAKRTNEEYRRRDIRLHEYDDPIKLQFQDVRGGNPQGADHVYATISEMQNANSPSTYSTPDVYQELNPSDREKDASHYQPLVQPEFSELQYVDILRDQAQAGSN